jgi:hypothetical protein
MKHWNTYKHGGCINYQLSPLYKVWDGMKARCYRPTMQYYKYYGGKGIMVCRAWRLDFSAFQKWALNHGYKQGLQIHRKNDDGHYSPSNCEWVTPKMNAYYRKSTNRFPNGESSTDIAKRLGVTRQTITRRIRMGMSLQQASSLPKTPNGYARKTFDVSKFVGKWKD